jgi:hypothetical protein
MQRKSEDKAGVKMLGRAEHASSKNRGKFTHNYYGDSSIGVLQREKHKEKTTSTTEFIVNYSPVNKNFPT